MKVTQINIRFIKGKWNVKGEGLDGALPAPLTQTMNAGENNKYQRST